MDIKYSATSERAFTLIEWLFSFFIISILCAISLPGWVNFYHRLEEEIFLSQFLHILTFAHDEAIIKNVPVAVCKSKNHESCIGDWQEGQLVFMDIYHDGSLRNKEQLLAVKQMKSSGSLHYRAYPYYRDYLLFTPQGWLKNDNGTFWFCAKESASPHFAIILTKSGKTRVAYPDRNGEMKDSRGRILTC